MPNNYFVIFLLVATLISQSMSSTCYNPDGAAEHKAYYQSCIAIDGARAMCCALSRTNPLGGLMIDGYVRDTCLWNRLYENIANITTKDGESTIWFIDTLVADDHYSDVANDSL
ncbi:hypothetical protein N7532_009943 [Penicillium argentinense]|uniref:Uncharacterized protein n=1 Tax=Penicillium argentinense TaxID=1131581 RepID=A0A9W9JY03_9EURO|nr:uncharacterized protein N7532_009943 [Penicillium argentinense]KAJ5085172.1 hypothetical protein N7532_009943 [Penicillium argentinense]